MAEEEDNDILLAEEGGRPPIWMTEEEVSDYNLTEEAEAALAAKRTLRDAREKQPMMRKSRSF